MAVLLVFSLQVLEHVGVPGKHTHLCVGGCGDLPEGFLRRGGHRLDLYGRTLLWDRCHKVNDTAHTHVIRAL